MRTRTGLDRHGWLLAGWVMATLVACAGQGRVEPAPGGLPLLPLGHVAAPAPALRSTHANGSGSFTGQQFTAQAGAHNQNLGGTAYELSPDANQTAWAQYSLALPAGNRLVSVVVDINAVGLGGAPPPGPYFVGLANYGQSRWEWRGPFTSANTPLTISAAAPRSDYVGPAGQAHCVVLDFAKAGAAAQPLAVVDVAFNYTDGASAPGWVTYTYTDGVHRILAQAGATDENLSLALNALSNPGTLDDSFLTISPNGQWLVLKTNRFDPEALGFAALAIVKSDLSSGAAVRAGGPAGTLLHPESLPAVASSGNLIVYSGQGGPHFQDVWLVSRANSAADWSVPLLLSGGSAEDYNEQPTLSADLARVLFHCGPTPYGQYGTKAAEVNVDGTGFHILLDPASPPPGYFAKHETRSPVYAPDGSIIFESDWVTDDSDIDDQRVWRLPAGGGTPFLQTQYDSNSPAMLPDGRIAFLRLGRPENLLHVHELTVMDADGTNAQVLVPEIDVLDIGIGAGAS